MTTISHERASLSGSRQKPLSPSKRVNLLTPASNHRATHAFQQDTADNEVSFVSQLQNKRRRIDGSSSVAAASSNDSSDAVQDGSTATGRNDDSGAIHAGSETEASVAVLIGRDETVSAANSNEKSFSICRGSVETAEESTAGLLGHDDDEGERLMLLANEQDKEENAPRRYPDEVAWNGKKRKVVVPEFCNVAEEDVLSRFDAITAFDRTRESHQTLRARMHRFVLTHFENRNDWVFVIQNATQRMRAVYAIVYPDGSIKIGMSMRAGARIRQQLTNQATGELSTTCHGYVLMPIEPLRYLIDQDDVDFIKSLHLPALAVHSDWSEWMSDSIRLYLAESFLACATRSCATGTVLERFTLLPSDDVSETVNPIASLSTETVTAALEFLSDIPGEGIHLLLSRSTFQSQLHEMKGETEFLSYMLRPLSDGGGFAKLYCLRNVLQTKCAGYRDAVSVSPSTKFVDNVIAALVPLLEGKTPETVDRKAVCRCLHDVQHENYAVYQEPTPEELDRGAFPAFREMLEEIADNECVYTERQTFSTMMRYNRDWMTNTLDLESAIHVLPSYHLTLVRMRHSSKRIIVTSSFFVMFAEEKTAGHIFGAAKSFLCLLELMARSGNVDPHHAQDQKAIIQAYLMNVECGDPNLNDSQKLQMSRRSGRIRACPRGYFWGSPKNVVCVCRQLKVHYCVGVYMYQKLQHEMFRLLLISHGLMYKGAWDGEYQDRCPLDPNYACEGLPSTPNYPAKPCAGHENLYTCCAGALSEDHIFHGLITCNRCLGDIQVRELDVLEHMHLSGGGQGLSPAQLERYRELERAKKTHAAKQLKKDRTARGEPVDSDRESVELQLQLDVPSWDDLFEMFLAFQQQTGRGDPTGQPVGSEFYALNQWATTIKQNKNTKTKLWKARTAKLNAHGFDWSNKSKRHGDDMAIGMIETLYQDHIADPEKKDTPFRISNSFQTKDGMRLGNWLSNLRKSKGKRLSADLRERLEAIVGSLSVKRKAGRPKQT